MISGKNPLPCCPTSRGAGAGASSRILHQQLPRSETSLGENLSLARHTQRPLLFLGHGGGREERDLEESFLSQSHIFVLLSAEKNEACPPNQGCQELVTVIALLLTETGAGCSQGGRAPHILQQ